MRRSLFHTIFTRWLIQSNRNREAQDVLNQLRTPERAEAEFREIEWSLTQDAERPTLKFMQMFSRRYLRRTLLWIFLMICLQMTGVRCLSFHNLYD